MIERPPAMMPQSIQKTASEVTRIKNTAKYRLRSLMRPTRRVEEWLDKNLTLYGKPPSHISEEEITTGLSMRKYWDSVRTGTIRDMERALTLAQPSTNSSSTVEPCNFPISTLILALVTENQTLRGHQYNG